MIAKAKAAGEDLAKIAVSYCVFKILNSKSLGLKILQSIFARPAAVAAFRRLGGRGYHTGSRSFPEWDQPTALFPAHNSKFICGCFSQATEKESAWQKGPCIARKTRAAFNQQSKIINQQSTAQSIP